ncbi:VWA domain-containing protein [Galactobacter valiniphilus]|uniref:VWA domain-containing protein n=1 Tax=Galactobacter valiniphilus TaxID=2676122 RepID=A0A399JLJ9_9MICC|nr:VWA domain-containing protein [Galactobacter valiniphilus]
MRPGTAWAAAAALIVAPLVVAPIVSAAAPGTDDAPAAVAAAAPAAQEQAAPVVADEAQPAAAAPAPAAQEAPAADEPAEASQPATQEAPATREAPASDTAAVAPASPASDEPSTPAAESSSSSAAAPASSKAGAQRAAAPASEAAPNEEAASEPVAAAAAITPLAAGDRGTVTVRVLLDRNGSSTEAATGYAGATVELVAKTRSRAYWYDFWSNWSASSVRATCVSTSTGLCSLDVAPVTYLFQYSEVSVNLVSTGAGVTRLSQVGTGSSGGSLTTVDVINLDGDKMPKANKTAKAEDITSDSTNNPRAVFSVVRNNPSLSGKCGLKLGLLMDVSGSIADSTDGVKNLKNAAKAFVSALQGTPSQVLIRNFADSSPAVESAEVGTLTSVATQGGVTTLNNAIDQLNNSNVTGATNWDAGLYRMRNAGLDAVVIVTDGVPTYRMRGNSTSGPGNSATADVVQHANWSANAVKAGPQSIIAVGVGSDFAKLGADLNLKLLAAGQVYKASDLGALKSTLTSLAQQNCKGTVNIVKRVTASGTTTEAASTPGVGFTFKQNDAGAKATDNNGAVSFDVTSSAAQKFTEVAQPDYEIVPQNGKPASCTADGASVTVNAVAGDANSFTVAGSTTKTITCVVYNKPKPKDTSLTIKHAWVDENGAAIPAADLSDIVANDGNPALKVNTGTAAAATYGATVSTWSGSALKAGDTATVTVGTAPSLKSAYTGSCTVQSVAVTPSGATALVAAAADNAFLVTHTLKCTTQLTLIKQVETTTDVPAAATLWDLTVTGKGTGKTGTSYPVTPGVAYGISESGGPSNLAANTNFELTNVVCSNGSYDAGTQKVTVSRGKSANCTFTNSLLRLEVTKTAYAGTPDPLSNGTELASGSPIFTGQYTWLFTIKNTGKAPIKLTSVSDPQLGNVAVTCSTNKSAALATWGAFSGNSVLPTGGTYYCKATGAVTR